MTLTKREIEVLKTHKENNFIVNLTATELCLTHETIDSHLARIRKKLGKPNTPAACLEAIRNGIIPL